MAVFDKKIDAKTEVKIITKNGFFITKKEKLKKIEKNIYKLSCTDIELFIDSLNIHQFFDEKNQIFACVPKMIAIGKNLVYENTPIYVLTAINNEKNVDFGYRFPREKRGTYGSVTVYPTEKIAVKTSVYSNEDVPPDFLKEIAIYKFLQQTRILPKMIKYSFGEKCRLQFEAGHKTLYDIYMGIIDIKTIMFQLINILKITSEKDI